METMHISAIRGAICVEADQKELIGKAACKLYAQMLSRNNLKESEIACLLLTQTGDLSSMNPATGLRKGGFCTTTPLFCMQELEIEGMLEKVVRMLMILNHPIQTPVAVFLDGAEKLRPDLALSE